MTLRMVTLGMPPSDPTTFYPPGGIVSSFRRPRHPFGLGATVCPPGQIYDYTLQTCRPAVGSNQTSWSPPWWSLAAIGVAGFGMMALWGYALYRDKNFGR